MDFWSLVEQEARWNHRRHTSPLKFGLGILAIRATERNIQRRLFQQIHNHGHLAEALIRHATGALYSLCDGRIFFSLVFRADRGPVDFAVVLVLLYVIIILIL